MHCVCIIKPVLIWKINIKMSWLLQGIKNYNINCIKGLSPLFSISWPLKASAETSFLASKLKLWQWPMLLSQTIRKRYFNTLGTSVINSLMSLLYLLLNAQEESYSQISFKGVVCTVTLLPETFWLLMDLSSKLLTSAWLEIFRYVSRRKQGW